MELNQKRRLNDGKCKSVIINSKDTLDKVALNGQEVEVVEEYKYLSFCINKDLKWDKQIQEIISRTSSTICLLKQLRSLGFKQEISINVYRSIILSQVNFAAPVLCSATKKSLNQRQNMQNRAFRIIDISRQRQKGNTTLEKLK